MALPNVSSPPTPIGPQQVFQNPNSVAQQNTQAQKIAEILTSINSRIGNITNMRTQAQGAVYNAFGNNFLTRGATQVTDSILDTVESVFAKKEAATEDPIVKALKRQSDVLDKLSSAIGSGNRGSGSDVEYTELIELTKTAETTRQQILSKIEDASKENRDFYSANIIALEAHKAVADKHLKLLEDMSKRRPSRKPKRVDDDGTSDGAVESASAMLSKLETVSVLDDKVEERHDIRQSSLLDKISVSMIDTNKLLKQFVSASPLSTQETEMEQYRKTNTISDVVDTRKVNPISKLSSAVASDDSSSMGFMKTVGAVIAGVSAFVTFFTGGPFKALVGALGAISKILPSIGGGGIPSIPIPGRNIPTAPVPTTPPVPGKAMGTMAKIGKSLAKVAIPAAIAAAAINGIDTLSGEFGIGDKTINTTADDGNWDRMSSVQKIESGAARGIEKLGSFIGLDNVVNESKAARIEKETSYLDNHLRKITEAQREIEQSNRKLSSNDKSLAQETPKTTIVNNSTYVPIRASVKNPDDSINRYLSSIMN